MWRARRPRVGSGMSKKVFVWMTLFPGGFRFFVIFWAISSLVAQLYQKFVGVGHSSPPFPFLLPPSSHLVGYRSWNFWPWKVHKVYVHDLENVHLITLTMGDNHLLHCRFRSQSKNTRRYLDYIIRRTWSEFDFCNDVNACTEKGKSSRKRQVPLREPI